MLAYTEVSIDYAKRIYQLIFMSKIENKMQKISLKLSNTLEAHEAEE